MKRSTSAGPWSGRSGRPASEKARSIRNRAPRPTRWRAEAVGTFEMLDHPGGTFAGGVVTNEARAAAFPDLEKAIELEEEVPPAKSGERALGARRSAGEKQLIQVEALGNRALWIRKRLSPVPLNR